ncbi:hypothetical protein AAHK07_01770 [Aliarcobacter cryaerophilus]|uniref:hypothetical protein n=1 Tax=Aliarcobacter cryaerophilus TaxID=28198 RepID=UPI003172D21E
MKLTNIENINAYLVLFIISSFIIIETVYFDLDVKYLASFILISMLFYINVNHFNKYYFMFLLFIFIMILTSTFINIDNIVSLNLNTVLFIFLLWSFLLLNINKFNRDKFYFLLKNIIYFILFISYILFFLKIQESPDAYTFHQNIFTGIFQNSFFASQVYFLFFILIINFGKDTKEDYLILFLLLISMFLTLSRTGLICSLFIVSLLYFRNIKIILILSILLLIALFFNESYIVSKYYERLFSGTSNRLDFWLIVIEKSILNLTSLFFGYGPNQTVIEFEGTKYSAHNSYIALIGDYGILIFILVSTIISVMMYKIRNNKKLLISFFALLLFAFFDVSLFVNGTFGFFIFMFLYSIRKKLHIYNKELEDEKYNRFWKSEIRVL